jgi:hypothetical protein
MKSKKETKKAKKTRELNDRFHEMKVSWLQQNPKCERCNGRASEVHHKKGRQFEEDGIPLVIYEKYFMSVCRDCHIYIEEINRKEAYEKGWLLYRHQVAS